MSVTSPPGALELVSDGIVEASDSDQLPSSDSAADDVLICRAAVAKMDRPAFDEACDPFARGGRVHMVLGWARELMRVPVLLRLVLLLRARLRRNRYVSCGA